ncbi:MAG: hypothetical protein CML05_08385 [Pseudozobellia sp.]|nr:hypothetical protein [Pseudozobellia sp.]|tara:strand:+ start:613159 stop:618723 length:5565 start_codon:yes stop_codon:yes gene_type:complete
MERVSVNGRLVPLDGSSITNEYTGHFLKVSYNQLIQGHSIFSKDRVDVDPEGIFRFFVPKKELLATELIIVEAYAPDGEMMGSQSYSHGALNSADIPIGAEDNTQELEIKINPKIITFNQSSPAESATKKLNGRVIDISGDGKTSHLEVLIMISEDASADFDVQNFKTVFSATTDGDGYFYGSVINQTVQQAFGVIAGSEDQPITIPLENNKLPKQVLLVADLSGRSEEDGCGCSSSTPVLPDSEDLVHSNAFSQDIGGSCVDFTIPNRTLEEFSFYHTVRTTEPEIKGLTINAKQTRHIREELFDISDHAFKLIGRMNNSFTSLSMVPYTIEEDNAPQQKVARATDGNTQPVAQTLNAFPNYLLKINTGLKTPFKINTNDLIAVENRLRPADIVKLAAEQAKKRKKLEALHKKLASAYCGKNGVQEAKTYCETLAEKDTLDREELRSLIGHVENVRAEMNLSAARKKQFAGGLLDLEKLVEKQNADAKTMSAVGKKIEALIIAVDSDSKNPETKEIMLGYLRRIVIELARAEEGSTLDFDPCVITAKPDNMGILCLIQKFKELKETLQNKSIFTLAEILEIKAYYDIFLNSIIAFLNLLDEFYTFYRSNLRFATELDDDYFYEHYDEIKNTLTSTKRQVYIALKRVEELRRAYLQNHPGRVELSVENSIDWDDTPTIYENTTIANGHILHFKQKWKAAGYSLGDLLYSLPLAPCQEKHIAIVDWDRNETGIRTEEQVATEQLQAQISRDRDITEIMSSSFDESISASSSNKTSSTSAAIGAGVGGFLKGVLFGVAGGVAHSGASSKSNANQNSSRNLSANALNRLQDSTSQSASSLRSQRSTVVQSVSQNESVSVQTEVIKNNNHCHAMTVEYFEVLKHYAIEQELVDVQECLFVPMPMSHFDFKKVLRWKNTLRKGMYGRKLLRGFDAIERIENNYANSDLPIGTYADVPIEEFTGHFTISFELDRPYIAEINEATKTEQYDLSLPFPWFSGWLKFPLEREVPLTEAEKDAIFEQQYAADIVRKFIDQMSFHAIADNGNEILLDFDVTLLSTYRKGVPLKVSINAASVPEITRRQIKHLRFRANTAVKSSSKIILRSAYLHYRTAHLSEYILQKNNINNDIINLKTVSIISGTVQVTDAALFYTPMNSREVRNPRKEDREAADALVTFLNEYLEMSHKVIWANMDSSRLFGLLDGYIAPHSGGRSVASVVENKVMGIVGNNLVLKVIPGQRLDPVFRSVEDLLEYYRPTTKPDPYRLSVPTKGVYAESVMGKCNSCEEIDETRHWRFSDEPCGCDATEIEPVSTASRRSEPADLQPKDFPSNIINMQTAPSAPDPTGLAAAFGLLGKSDVFKDMTGLEGTQANALQALQTTSKSATDMASISKDFANLALMGSQKEDGAKQIEQIKKLNKDGYLNDEETTAQIKKVLDSYTNAADKVSGKKEGENKDALTKDPEIKKAISNASNSESGNINVSRTTPDGSETVSVSKDDKSGTPRILENPDLDAESRSFQPATSAAPGNGSKTGEATFSVSISNMPAGGYVKWSVPPANDGDYTLKNGPKATIGKQVTVQGIKPGLSHIDVEVKNVSDQTVQSLKLPLSIPQFVTIEESAAEFDQALTDLGLTTLKDAIIGTAKTTCDHLLVGTNVRTIWQLGTFSETLPAHIPANKVTKMTVRNQHATDLYTMGVTHNVAGAVDNIVPNRTIDIYPNAFDDSLPNGAVDPTGLDVETQALLIQLKSQGVGGDPQLEQFASDFYGRLIGETMAHEIIHALLWDIIEKNGHNDPTIADDIMNNGGRRTYTQRTGFVDDAMQSPVDPDNFTDNGLGAINRLQTVNQERMDQHFPVPGARMTSFK